MNYKQFQEKYSTQNTETRKRRIYKGLKKRGISEDDIKAILANIGVETAYTYDPRSKQYLGKNYNYSDENWFKNTGAGRGTGFIQWDDRRKNQYDKKGKLLQKGLKEFAEEKGKPWDDFETQLDFLEYELKGTEKSNFEKVKKAKTLKDKTLTFSREVERPGEPHEDKRLKELKKIEKIDFSKPLIEESTMQDVIKSLKRHNIKPSMSVHDLSDDELEALLLEKQLEDMK